MGLTLREALRSDEIRGELRDLVRQEMDAEVDRRVEEALSRPSTVAKVARSGRPDMAVLDGAGDEALASAAEKRLDRRVEETRRALAGPGETPADEEAAKRRLAARLEAVRAVSESEGRRVSRVGVGVLESMSGSADSSEGADASGTVRLQSGRVLEAEFAAERDAPAWAQRMRVAGVPADVVRSMGGSAA